MAKEARGLINLALGNRDHRFKVEQKAGTPMLTADNLRLENISTVRWGKLYVWHRGKGRYSGAGWWKFQGRIKV